MKKSLLALVLLGALAAGCNHHYRVSDPLTNQVFYTRHIHREKESGAVKFHDARTGQEIVLQNSEVRDIPKEEFEAAIGK